MAAVRGSDSLRSHRWGTTMRTEAEIRRALELSKIGEPKTTEGAFVKEAMVQILGWCCGEENDISTFIDRQKAIMEWAERAQRQ